MHTVLRKWAMLKIQSRPTVTPVRTLISKLSSRSLIENFLEKLEKIRKYLSIRKKGKNTMGEACTNAHGNVQHTIIFIETILHTKTK